MAGGVVGNQQKPAQQYVQGSRAQRGVDQEMDGSFG